MPTHDETHPFAAAEVMPQASLNPWRIRSIAALLATLAMLAAWKITNYLPYVDTDSYHYLAMAAGKTAMKPFAFRVLDPAAARLFAFVTGRTATQGFRTVALLSGWVLLYTVLTPVLRRRQNMWYVALLILLPFWTRNLTNYILPDLLHAALGMVYLTFLRKRWWGAAAAMLAVMFLARESTLLLAMIAIPMLWSLVSRRVALLQLGGTILGLAASKFAARHATANQHQINDTLYMIGKVPWNTSKNLFGVTLWTNTLPTLHPIRIWNVPHWIPLGGIHQIGYSAFERQYLFLTAFVLLTSFGLGLCTVLCLLWRAPLRSLFASQEPYLCVAAVYGGLTFLMSPMLGASLFRLFDYGWPLFLVYLPAAMPRMWRSWSAGTVSALIVLHFFTAWLDINRLQFFRSETNVLAILIACNLAAAWMLLRSSRSSTSLLPSAAPTQGTSSTPSHSPQAPSSSYRDGSAPAPAPRRPG